MNMNKLKELIHSAVRSSLRNTYRTAEATKREKIVSQLPKAPLEEKHVRNCQLVLNRRSMLHHIGQQEVVAELGVNRGEFSEVILEVAKPAVLHLVDVWGSDRYHQGLFNEVSTKFKKRTESGGVQIHRKLSTEASTEFPDEYFDMVYIDTDHSYRTTKEELLAYSTKMKRCGIIAGHDYSMGNWVKSYRYGVIEAVHEFCVNFDWEFCFLTAEPLESKSFAIRKIQQPLPADARV
jgi:hypothetical protein